MQISPRLPRVVLAFVVVFASFLIVACQPVPQPIPLDDVAIQATVDAQVAATVAVLAQNIQATERPASTATDNPEPTATVTPTVGPTATPTSLPTDTPIATDTPTPIPTDTPAPTDTPTPDPYAYTATKSANLRGGPGTNYAVAGSLQPGDRFAISARTQAGDWFQIETAAGKSAWVAAFLVVDAPSVESIPVATDIPTPPTPAPQGAVASTQPTGTRLQVDFINPHYNCDRGDGLNDFYRYFQADFFITNTSSETIEARWEPTRWIITSGGETRIDDRMWEWYSRATGHYEQPDIPPGGSQGWTFVAPRVEMHEWVQAVEWDYNGQTYRQEFENNAMNRAEWNYIGCQ